MYCPLLERASTGKNEKDRADYKFNSSVDSEEMVGGGGKRERNM